MYPKLGIPDQEDDSARKKPQSESNVPCKHRNYWQNQL